MVTVDNQYVLAGTFIRITCQASCGLPSRPPVSFSAGLCFTLE